MMNIPFLAAALLLTVAFLAHLLVGTRETLSLSPDGKERTEQKRRNWIQALCAFQLVSVDLLLLAIVAYLLAATQILEARREIACFMATYLGVPVSTTHTITGAIVGVGAARRVSAVRWNVASSIVYAWVITIPASAIVAAATYWAVLWLR